MITEGSENRLRVEKADLSFGWKNSHWVPESHSGCKESRSHLLYIGSAVEIDPPKFNFRPRRL